MLSRCFLFGLFFLVGWVRAGFEVTRVDFLEPMRLKVNGAGPILVEADGLRGRVIVVQTNTSSVSIIAGVDHNVTNVPIQGRVPQYLKSEALAIDARTGNIYVVGNASLHIIFPETRTSLTVDTEHQYEMVAVDPRNGNAFLVGRASPFLMKLDLATQTLKKQPWRDLKETETMINLNQTPPPPIQKVICDPDLDRVVAIDGKNARLCTFSATDLKPLKTRRIATRGGSRWHFAGTDPTTHHAFVVVETADRKAIEAIEIDLREPRDIVVPLPEFTEAVGVAYNPIRHEVVIPYDNHPSVHVVTFQAGGEVAEIKVPAYGNDASALSKDGQTLYISNWAYGEIDVIDLKTRRLVKRIEGLGILPHMFNMAPNPANGNLYFALGATAVNGSFGAAVDWVDPETEDKGVIPTGWAPVDLIQIQGSDSFLVFNSESQCAVVQPDGSFVTHPLPIRFPIKAIASPENHVYLSYGPHQSYWPVVYIWGAKNGILGDGATVTIPFGGRPDALLATDDSLVFTKHAPNELIIVRYDHGDRTFHKIHAESYPFGETTVDTHNTAFFLSGQFADGVFQLNQMKRDAKGRIWVTDYLSGRLFIIKEDGS